MRIYADILREKDLWKLGKKRGALHICWRDTIFWLHL